MEALIASYGDASSDSDSDSPPPPPQPTTETPSTATISSAQLEVTVLPPPPVSLLVPPNSTNYFEAGQSNRVRSFAHVEGNYALHVYIPVYIPSASKKEIVLFLKTMSCAVPSFHVVDADIPLDNLCKDEQKLEQVALGREFHISLGRTVPIRVHQIDSVVSMLRQRLQLKKRYWIDFSKWEAFVNDEKTRSFLSLEVVSGGLNEISKQIESVNQVYKLHNLPEFYKDPRPHISLAWALGDISDSMKRMVEEEIRRSSIGGSSQKCIFTCKFSGIDCKIGNKTYKICKFSDE